MKKVLSITIAALMLVMTFCFAGCGAKKDAPTTDSEYVKANGKLVVGITDFAPMDYQDKDKNWIGFDADMAKEFAKTLGVDVEFVEIVWDNKVSELNNKSIDCIWNGMTLVDEVTSSTSCTDPYCNNAQVVVVNKDVADKYQTVESCKSLKFAVEAGSAGKEVADENGFKVNEVKDQATALMEVASGTSDAAIIDSLMAGAMIGEGTSYANLVYTVSLNSEKYGVAFRQGSDLTALLNEFFKTSMENGKMVEIAKTYGCQEALIK